MSKKGFGLVEVMVAVAITTVIALGFSQLMNFQIQGQSAVSANGEISNIQKIVSFAMEDSTTCSAQSFSAAGLVFKITPPIASNPPVPLPAPATLKYTSGAVIVSTKAPNNDLGNGLLVSQIQLQPSGQVNATTFTMLLQIIAQKKAGTVTGSNTFTANIPISVQATVVGPNAKITACTSGTPLSCPVGWTLVGVSASSPEAFCITTAAQPANTVPNAILKCNNNVAFPGHLCTPSEWSIACTLAGGALGLPDAAEWVNNFVTYDNGGGGNVGMVMGTSGTNGGSGLTCFGEQDWSENMYATPYPYRCCAK